MLEDKNFIEFLKLLDANKVRYLLVGGYAVNYYGYVRNTVDMDIFVAATPENAKALVRVYNDFGFESLGLKASDFMDPDAVIEIGREPLKLHVMNDISGVLFAEGYASREIWKVAGLEIPVIGRRALLKNKQASGRKKDLADVEELEKLKQK